MKAIELYKFISKNSIEWHYFDNDGVQDVIIFPKIEDLGEFNNLFSKNHFDDEGVECFMKDGYFAFWMYDICNYYGIELSDVFEKGGEFK